MNAPFEAMPLRAIAGKVVIQPEPRKEGIVHLVNSGEDVFGIGTVLSMGPDAEKDAHGLKVGDRVLYARSLACTTAMKDRHVIHHGKVLCVVEGDGDLQAKTVRRTA